MHQHPPHAPRLPNSVTKSPHWSLVNGLNDNSNDISLLPTTRDELHPRFGENDDSPFRGFRDSCLFFMISHLFQFVFSGHHFSQPRGQAKRSRDRANGIKS
jgi:hypothetical protein